MGAGNQQRILADQAPPETKTPPVTPGLTEVQPVQAERVAEMRKVFDANKDKHAAETKPHEPAPEPKTTEPKAEPEPAPAAETETPPETGVSEGGDETRTQQRPEGHEKALRVLKLANVPDTVLEATSPDELLTWAANVTERNAGINRAFSENAEFRSRIDDLEKATAKAEPDAPTAKADLSETLDPFVQELGLSDEGKDKLAALLGAATQPLQERLKRAEDALQSHSEGRERHALDESRRRLAERFPGLDSAEQTSALEGRVALLAKDPAYGKHATAQAAVDAVVADAARSLSMKEVDPKADKEAETARAAEKAAERAERNNGTSTPTVTPRAPVSNTPVDQETRIRMIFDHRLANPGISKSQLKRYAESI